ETLFQALFAGKGDAAAGGDYTLPRQAVGLAERPHHLASRAGKPGSGGYPASRRGPAAQEPPNCGAKAGQPGWQNLLVSNLMRRAFQHCFPGVTAIVGRLSLEKLRTRVGEFIGRPDLDGLTGVFETAGIGPDAAFDLDFAAVGLASGIRDGHVA